jgi:molecular chaperone GrpE
MTENQKNNLSNSEGVTQEAKDTEQKLLEKATEEENIEELKKSLAELNDKYVRLYADFENYKKLVAKEKEELIKYSNEELMRELLTVIDHLELALQHSSGNETPSSLTKGIEMTLKELKSILEKYGLVNIDALGKPFDPFVHHALSQIESEEAEENTVVTEFRKGYMLKDRVLRAALVGVSKKPSKQVQTTETKEEE